MWYCCSVSQSCLTLCNPMNCDMPHPLTFTILSVLKRMSIESIMPTISSSVIPFSSCLQSFPASGSFPKSRLFYIRWPKYWNFSFSISPSSEYSGLISFRIDWLDLFAVQGTLRIHYFKTAPLSFNIYLPGELHFLSFFFKR